MHNNKPFKFRFEIEGELMNQATAQFTVNVKAGTSAGVITITPSSGTLPDEFEGVATSDQVAVISVDKNVVLPLNYNFTGQPDGVTFNETANADGTFTITTAGKPTVGDAVKSPYTISLTVTDSSTAVQARAQRDVRVL
jgi:hypothetical protein